MDTELSKPIVYYDGSCPLCRAEIGYYRKEDQDNLICFVDVSQPETADLPDLTQQQAMARFHVRDARGQLLSGAAAFAAVWASLPRWRWAARLAGMPGAGFVLERAYRAFLPIRPFLSRLFGRLRMGGAKGDGESPV